jgi:hypothetical protein
MVPLPQTAAKIIAAPVFALTMFAAPATAHDTSGFELLYSFTGASDGGQPTGTLTLDKAGNLFGTTCHGGKGGGVVYRLGPHSIRSMILVAPTPA